MCVRRSGQAGLVVDDIPDAVACTTGTTLLIDHLLATVFAIGFPALATPVYARRRPFLLAGDRGTKRREYRESILWLAGMGVVTLIVWISTSRNLAMLGLSVEASWKLVLGLAVAGGGAALLFRQVRAVERDARAQDAARRALESVREYLPSSRDEVPLFRGIAYAAGIGEELFYRGFLIWYLDQLLPLVGAVVASSVLFGLAHIMHGMAATLRATVTGLVLAGLYLFSGALWPSMLLHTAVDLSSGSLGLAVYGRAASVTANQECT